MKKIITVLLLISFAQTASYTLAPLVYAHYESGGKTWDPQNKSISVVGWGIALRAKIDRLNIELDAYNNRFTGISQKPNYFNHNQGLSWVGNDPRGEQFDFDVTNTKFSYNYKSISFEFGKYNKHWGPGISSLIISDKVPSFPQFGFTYNVDSNFKFEYFHGSLRSLIEDTNNSQFYDAIGEERPELNRFVAGHRFEWDITDKLSFGASELVVYGVRELDLIYLLPVAPFLSLQQYAGDLDNIQWELDLHWKYNEKINFYGSFLMDEWTPSMTFDSKNRNWFAYQLGINCKQVFTESDELIIEHNWTDHRIYRHQNEINNYYSHGYPLGFWGGPHAEEMILKYSFKKFDLSFLLEYSFSKRGELTNQMLTDQYDNVTYERYSNISEELSVFDIIITKEIVNGFNIHIGMSYIAWVNGNFNPYYSLNENQSLQEYSSELIDISKHSILIGFSQNFDIFNQKVKFSKDSIKKIISL